MSRDDKSSVSASPRQSAIFAELSVIPVSNRDRERLNSSASRVVSGGEEDAVKGTSPAQRVVRWRPGPGAFPFLAGDAAAFRMTLL